jgi:hypothetical protein
VTGSGDVRSENGQLIFVVRIILKKEQRLVFVATWIASLGIFLIAAAEAFEVTNVAGVAEVVATLLFGIFVSATPLIAIEGASRNAKALYQWAMEVSSA